MGIPFVSHIVGRPRLLLRRKLCIVETMADSTSDAATQRVDSHVLNQVQGRAENLEKGSNEQNGSSGRGNHFDNNLRGLFSSDRTDIFLKVSHFAFGSINKFYIFSICNIANHICNTVQSWISASLRLKFCLLFQFMYFCTSVYFN